MINATDENPSVGEIIRRTAAWTIDWALSERLGIIIVDGRKVANGDLDCFKEAVKAIGLEEAVEWISGVAGSCWYGDAIYIAMDVPEEARQFVLYHEYKHLLDYVARGIVPAEEHVNSRSSKLEKECDLYALRRVLTESGDVAAEKAINWMVGYHFQWDTEHPEDPSDLLYRAILLYRFCRRQGSCIDPVFNMKKLQKSKRWWG